MGAVLCYGVTVKICGYQECGKKLHADNASGFCSAHWAIAQPELARAFAKERTRRWRERNPERAKESARRSVQKWRDSDPVAARAYKDTWNEAHPERYRDHYIAGTANRRARKIEAFVEHVDPAIVWERDGGICHICREPADPADWHLEHVVALAKGGEHSYANVAVSHPACNQRKGTKTLT